MSFPPGTHNPATELAFLGREPELAALRAGLQEALQGGGKLFLLVGEPGIGKTRLSVELAKEASERGAVPLWGRCDENIGAPPFWPWAQILRRLSERFPEAVARVGLPRQIVPSPQPNLEPSSTRWDNAEERFELFDQVERLFEGVAREQPLVLILDDLHAADLPSLQLLRFLARQVHESRILLLASYRAADLERSSERAQILNPISRQGTRLPLASLGEEYVASLVARALRCDTAHPLVASLYRWTEGNPLFVGEVVRLLLAEQAAARPLPLHVDAIRIPHGIEAVIQERLAPLSTSCRHVLGLASVLGREVETAALRGAYGLSATECIGAIEEAERAGLVEWLGTNRERFQFTHGLIRTTLHDALAPAERADSHHRIARFLEEGGLGNAATRVAAIAHHYSHSPRPEDADKAIDFLVQAATQAVQQWAYEEADDLFQQAGRILDAGNPGAIRRRCEVLLAQGRAQYAAGRADARDTFRRAAELARQIAAEEPVRGRQLLADAALGVAGQGLGLPRLEPDETAIALLEEAWRGIASDEGALRARLAARLAAHLSFPATESRSLGLVGEAEAAARGANDDHALAEVLGQRHLVLWRFNVIPGRHQLASEVLELAERLGDRNLAWEARAWRVVDAMTVGDSVGVDADLQVVRTYAETSRQPRLRWMANNFRVARAMWRGQWEEASALALESMRLAAELEDPLAQAAGPFQLYWIDRERGGEPDEAKIRWILQRFPESAMIRAVLITVLLDLGRSEEAQVELDAMAVGEFAMVTRERRLGALALLSEACWRLESTAHAEALTRLLEPYADYNVMYSSNVCFGAATRYLGGLAATRGETSRAVAWLTDAIERNRRMGATALEAWTRLDAARAWRRWATQPDAPTEAPERARTLLDESRKIAHALGMARLLHELDQMPETPDTGLAPEPDVALPAVRVQRGAFLRDGEYWSIGDGNEMVRIRDTKGLHYIAALLRNPGREIHVLDLADAAPGTAIPEREVAPPRWRDLAPMSDAHPLLDGRARAAYRHRLAELREAIEEASANNDIGRVDYLRQEEQSLQDELARAVGLNGRNRASGSVVERTRLNVTRAIKTAQRKIAAASPGLGHVFTSTIRTGNLCCYTPDPRVRIRWDLHE